MTSSDPPPVRDARWTPHAMGALDVAATGVFVAPVEIVILPADGSPPMGLIGEGAALWRRLCTADGIATDLDSGDEQIAQQLATAGFLTRDRGTTLVVRDLRVPVLSSPVHELVYALVARVADGMGIPCVFVKGPMLMRQGLRDREHSGDVDVWCDPTRWDDLVDALTRYGWVREPDPWRGTKVGHSVTLSPSEWGCQIDVHRRMPGMSLSDDAAFEAIFAETVVEMHAGVEVLFPAADPHAVVAALHAARPEIGLSAPSSAPAALAVQILDRAADPVGTAVRLGAVTALRRELQACRPGVDLPPDDRAPHDWFWRAQPDRVRAYLAAIRDEPLVTRVRVLARLVWPSAEVVRESARRAGEPEHGPVVARVRRLRRGLLALLSGAHRPRRR